MASRLDANNDDDKFKPFRFFDLPRELRNKVYCDVKTNPQSLRVGSSTSVEVFNYVPGNLRTVNHQIKAESEEEILRLTEFNISLNATTTGELSVAVSKSAPGRARLIDKIQKVKLRVDPYVSGWEKPGDLTVTGAIGIMTDLFTGMRLLHFEMCTQTQVVERGTGCCGMSFKDFLSLGMLASGMHVPVTVRPVLLISGDLWCALQTDEFDAWPPWEMPSLDYPYGDEITYRAKLADNGSGWHGLELETEYATTSDYQEMLKHIRGESPSFSESDDDDSNEAYSDESWDVYSQDDRALASEGDGCMPAEDDIEHEEDLSHDNHSSQEDSVSALVRSLSSQLQVSDHGDGAASEGGGDSSSAVSKIDTEEDNVETEQPTGYPDVVASDYSDDDDDDVDDYDDEDKWDLFGRY